MEYAESLKQNSYDKASNSEYRILKFLIISTKITKFCLWGKICARLPGLKQASGKSINSCEQQSGSN